MDDHADTEALYAKHASAVFAYALRRTDRPTAEDVVGEVFLVAWRKRDAIAHDELAWLLGIARKVLANSRRSRLRRLALQERLANESPAASAELPERQWPVLRALARLREKDREAILLVAWDELDSRTAANVLGLRQRSFEARLYRARRRLAAVLEQETRTDPPVRGHRSVAQPLSIDEEPG